MPAVAFDATAQNTKIINNVPGSGDPLIISMTVGSGTNKLLVVGIAHEDSVGNNFMNDSSYIVSCTYNSVAMTFIGSVQIASAIVDVYYLINPTSGTHDVRVEFDDSVTPGANLLVTAGGGAVSFTNCDQTVAVIAQSGFATGLNSPITKALTTASADNMLVDATVSVLTTTISAASGQTSRVNQQYGTAGSIQRQGMSTRQATGGSDTMSWTEGTTTRDWATFVVELKAVVAAATSPQLTLLGVGQ